MARRFEDVVDAAEGKGDRGSGGIGTKWLLLPAEAPDVCLMTSDWCVGTRRASRQGESRAADLRDDLMIVSSNLADASSRSNGTTQRRSSARNRDSHGGRAARKSTTSAERQAAGQPDLAVLRSRGREGDFRFLLRSAGRWVSGQRFDGFGGRDIAVDRNRDTLVYVRGRASCRSRRSSRSTSAAARCTRSGSRPSACSAARRWTISAHRSLKDGVIADFDVTGRCSATSSGRCTRHHFAQPRVVRLRPVGQTGVEHRAVEEANAERRAGAVPTDQGADGRRDGAGAPSPSRPEHDCHIGAGRRRSAISLGGSSSARACASAATRWTRR